MPDNIVRLADRVKEISYTMGTGNMALAGAVAGFESFSSNFSNNDVVFYAITDGSTYEVGSGVFLSTPYSQLKRSPISSSNNNNLINFSEGIKEVYVTYPATHSVYMGSGISNLNIPSTDNIAFWASPNTLDASNKLVWKKDFNRLGINKSNPDYGIDVGGDGSESIVKASGFVVGSSGIYFQPYGSYSGGLQLTHQENNQLDQYALTNGLIGQLTGTSAVLELSGVANQYILFKKQNAGLVFAGPASGCTPPCSPAYPSFRQLTIEDVPAISQVSGILNNKIFTLTSTSNSTTLAVSGILNNKIDAVSGIINNTNMLLNNENIACGRLTLESNQPVSINDQNNKSILYYTPYLGSKISLYNISASKWETINFTQASLTLSGLVANTNYDIFGYNNAGSLLLESVIWSNDSTRSVALTIQNGVYCRSNDLSRRYLGTIRTVSTTATSDTEAQRLVWNINNKVSRKVYKVTDIGPWTYSSNTYRPLNNVIYKIDVVCGLSSLINLNSNILFTAPQNGQVLFYYFGIAKGSNTTPLMGTRYMSFSNQIQIELSTKLIEYLGEGYNYYYPVEAVAATTTPATLYGGLSTSYFGGTHGTWEC